MSFAAQQKWRDVLKTRGSELEVCQLCQLDTPHGIYRGDLVSVLKETTVNKPWELKCSTSQQSKLCFLALVLQLVCTESEEDN